MNTAQSEVNVFQPKHITPTLISTKAVMVVEQSGCHSSQYDRITARIKTEKTRLNLLGEVKWSKVSAPYLSKYQDLVHVFFEEVRAGLIITPENITEIRSHDHVLAQCLDIILGAMSFRLNDKQKEIPQGKSCRGKRTIAKEKLYRTILAEIQRIKPHFNIGISTGTPGGLADRWSAPYLHWCFKPSETELRKELTKGHNEKGPNQPT